MLKCVRSALNLYPLRCGHVAMTHKTPFVVKQPAVHPILTPPVHLKALINGVLLDGDSPDFEIDVVAPANGELLCDPLKECSLKQVEIALQSASQCVHNSPWSSVSKTPRRVELLKNIAKGIEEKREFFAQLESSDNGKTEEDAALDVTESIAVLRYFADMALKISWSRTVKCSDTRLTCIVDKVPYGVVVAITPWNYPLLMAVQKIAPAIAAGCTVILKPSEVTMLTALELAQVVRDAGAPAGSIQVIIGDRKVGAALVASPLVDKISFTGSERAGSAIMESAAKNVCPVAMELGGKSAAVIFEDANFDHAIRHACMGIFMQSGQVCSATSRLLVHHDVFDSVVKRVVKNCEENIAIGLPIMEKQWLELGPLVSESHLERVHKFVKRAEADGARLLCGGAPIERLNGGFYFPPTVFVDVSTDSELWRDEVFGPVVSIHSFKDEREAIAMTNDSRYGLSAAVFTNSKKRIYRFKSQCRVGACWVNCNQQLDVRAPWGGLKRSGFGRENGVEGFKEFLTTKMSMESEQTSFPLTDASTLPAEECSD